MKGSFFRIVKNFFYVSAVEYPQQYHLILVLRAMFIGLKFMDEKDGLNMIQ